MNKTKIEWTDYTWNPIKGICPVGCWYCYARKFYQRFYLNKQRKGKFNRNELAWALEAIDPIPKKSSKIFVCSTIELFHSLIPAGWRDAVFSEIERLPQHVFQVLTKFPQNIDRPMPDNVWLGVSIGDNYGKSMLRTQSFIKYIEKNEGFYFLSIEPLIRGYIDHIPIEKFFPYFGWIIVGKLTGYGKRYNPPLKSIERIVKECEELCIPIFLKDNLKEIWGEPLIQEFPDDRD